LKHCLSAAAVVGIVFRKVAHSSLATSLKAGLAFDVYLLIGISKRRLLFGAGRRYLVAQKARESVLPILRRRLRERCIECLTALP
jgi:hypothetical protein